MARLLIVRGAEIGIEYELADVTEIGRSSECTIQLLDQSVSRRHARIVRREKHYFVENLSGTSEIDVNGARVRTSARLADNDEISIGVYGFIFNPELTMVRARYGEQVLIISPHRPERLDLEPQAREAALREKSLRTLNAVLEHCLLLDDTAACLKAVLEEVVEHFAMQRGFAVLFKGDQVELAAAAGDSARMIISRTIVETIRETGRVIVSQDACSDVQFKKGLSLVEGKLRTILCAPILDGRRVLGFLQVDSSGAPGRIPADAHALLEKVSRCLGRAVSRTVKMKSAEQAVEPAADFVATSRIMKRLLENVDKAAQADSTCVISGETGTGKEVAARMIHRRSGRREGPFIAVNCAAIPETIIESELFGFEKGSFTGAYKTTPGKIELSDGGTLFLDEIGDMSLYAQAKLLRFLQERVFYRIGAKRYTKVDVRIIAATNRDLPRLVKEGRFREDLYYRLAVIPLSVPPLRERKEDIPVMAELFLDHFCKDLKRSPVALSPGMIGRLQAYGWPGNVRELRNMMERFAVLGHEPESLATGWAAPGRIGAGPPEDGPEGMEEEKTRIVEALRRNRGNKSKAAVELGISRPTLDSKIRKHAIDIFR
jgi:Nif-specific regulatory protein